MIMKIPAPKQTANIAVIGAGWWSQGWHLPHLHRNDHVKLAAIVDSSSHPKSNLNPCLEPLAKLAEAYKVQNTFSSVADLLNDPNVGPTLDGALVATPHATHYEVGELLLGEGMRRKRDNKDYRPMNILMEKPMTTNVHEAKKMHDVSWSSLIFLVLCRILLSQKRLLSACPNVSRGRRERLLSYQPFRKLSC
jgi:predicted dehydrogenase